MLTYFARVVGFDKEGNLKLDPGGQPFRKKREIRSADFVFSELKWLNPLIPEFWRDDTEGAPAVRYYGYLDLDAKGDKEEIKKALVKSTTLQEFYDQCEPIRNVFDAVRRIMDEIQPVESRFAFFTGFKGARVCFLDAKYWRSVLHKRKGDNGSAGLKVALSGLSPETIQFVQERCEIDPNPYGAGKGIKTDLICHHKTKRFAAKLYDDTGAFSLEGDVGHFLMGHLDVMISHFWKCIFESSEEQFESADELVLEPRSNKRKLDESPLDDNERRVRALLNECNMVGEATIKPHEENSYLVTLEDQWCCVGQKLHSSSGKTYYIADMEKMRIFAKCFSCQGGAVEIAPPWGIFMDRVLENDTVGFVEEYVARVEGNIKMNDIGDKKCFVFNEEKALWEHKGHQFAENLVSRLLLPFMQKWIIPGKSGDKTKKALIRFITSTQGQRNIFLQARTSFEDPSFKTDRVPYLLPIRHARVVDLQTGEVRARTAGDLFSFECDVDFDGDLNRATPHAERFFADVFEAALYNYMQTQFGYCLTGETVARCFFVWYGIGSNGKSECSKVLKRVLGDFFTTLAPKAVMTWKDNHNGPGNASPHLVTLAKARCAMVSETGPNDQINENFVKSWTGSDEICVRALYSEEEKIKPQAKLIIQTNNKPKISAEQAIIDRTHMTEFGARFTKNPVDSEKQADPQFVRALLDEHIDEVFLWMLHGSIRFYREGLKLEDSALNSTLEFFQENDHVGAFLRSHCLEAPYCSVPRTDLYTAFKTWCDHNYIPTVTATEFYAKLTNKGFQLGSGGQRKVKGLRLRKAGRDEEALQIQETRTEEQVLRFSLTRARSPSFHTPRKELYQAFNKVSPGAQCSASEFYAHLRALGYSISKGGCRNVAGIALAEAEDEKADEESDNNY